jgi:hypothetical protein
VVDLDRERRLSAREKLARKPREERPKREQRPTRYDEVARHARQFPKDLQPVAVSVEAMGDNASPRANHRDIPQRW